MYVITPDRNSHKLYLACCASDQNCVKLYLAWCTSTRAFVELYLACCTSDQTFMQASIEELSSISSRIKIRALLSFEWNDRVQDQ